MSRFSYYRPMNADVLDLVGPLTDLFPQSNGRTSSTTSQQNTLLQRQTQAATQTPSPPLPPSAAAAAAAAAGGLVLNLNPWTNNNMRTTTYQAIGPFSAARQGRTPDRPGLPAAAAAPTAPADPAVLLRLQQQRAAEQ